MAMISSIPGIDVGKTLESLGIPETVYVEMLGGFRRDILSKIDLIREKVTLSDLTDFVILVHGVKGAARTVGISELADRMYSLELAGKAGDRELIDKNIEDTLSLYAKYDELLKPYDSSLSKNAVVGKSESELMQTLKKLRDLLENFESEEAEKLVKLLGSYDISREQQRVFTRLRTAIDNFDYFTSLECVKEMMEVTD